MIEAALFSILSVLIIGLIKFIVNNYNADKPKHFYPKLVRTIEETYEKALAESTHGAMTTLILNTDKFGEEAGKTTFKLAGEIKEGNLALQARLQKMKFKVIQVALKKFRLRQKTTGIIVLITMAVPLILLFSFVFHPQLFNKTFLFISIIVVVVIPIYILYRELILIPDIYIKDAGDEFGKILLNNNDLG